MGNWGPSPEPMARSRSPTRACHSISSTATPSRATRRATTPAGVSSSLSGRGRNKDLAAIEVCGDAVHPVGGLAEFLARPGDDVGFEEGVNLFTALPEVITTVLARVGVIDEGFGNQARHVGVELPRPVFHERRDLGPVSVFRQDKSHGKRKHWVRLLTWYGVMVRSPQSIRRGRPWLGSRGSRTATHRVSSPTSTVS